MTDVLVQAEENQRRAWQIIRDSKVIECWQEIGAEVHLVGSLKMGVLAKHRDIDFHIYTPKPEIGRSFDAVRKLAENPRIRRVTYQNLLQEEDCCLEWHAWYEDEERKLWQIDMMHIAAGSRYDGYFEKQAERIMALMTPVQRQVILELKFATPDNEKIMGIAYYMAVLRDGVRDYAAFEEWLKRNPLPGIVDWMP